MLATAGRSTRRAARPLVTADDIALLCRQAAERLAAATTPKEERAIRDELREQNNDRIFVNAKPYFRRPPHRTSSGRRGRRRSRH